MSTRIRPWFLSVMALTLLGIPLVSLALDPVAPRAERKLGELLVKSPLPQSDVCEIASISKKGETFQEAVKQTFKPGEKIRIPVGDYFLKVKLQDAEWTSNITVQPTERTDVTVTGYGNLKVITPKPKSDTVEVYSLDGKMVKSFNPTEVKTLPTGIYNVKVKMNGTEVTENNVNIVTNTTREVSASVE
jgi:hypothetical protein